MIEGFEGSVGFEPSQEFEGFEGFEGVELAEGAIFSGWAMGAEGAIWSE